MKIILAEINYENIPMISKQPKLDLIGENIK